MLEPPAPAAVMHVPFSGLPRVDDRQRNDVPSAPGFSRMIGLKATFTSLSAKSCSLRKSSSAGKALDRVGVEVAADRDADLARHLADVLDDPVERALAAAQRTHPVVRVAVAVERDLHVVETVGQQAIDELFGQQQAVGDDAERQRDAARRGMRMRALGQVVHDRNVEQRLAAEERDRQLLRLQLVEPLLDPVGDLRAVVERHLVGVLVVVAVVALEAVVAREIALQRRQHRDAQLLGVFAVVGEELVQRLACRSRGSATMNPCSVSVDQRFARIAVEPLRRERRRDRLPDDRACRRCRPRQSAARRSACSSGTLRRGRRAGHER